MNTINELIERAHSQAKAMGWWDEERNTGELLMLVVSECGEALEAHRKGRMGKWQDCTLSMVDADGALCLDEDLWVDDFKEFIKDGFADELADIVIRIADLCGGENLFIHPINGEQSIESIQSGDLPETNNTGEALLDVVKELLSPNGDMGLRAWEAMLAAGRVAAMHGIDLNRHIELKLRYNLTRGVRHGKAY